MSSSYYRAFGLLIEAEFELPELLPADPDAAPDIRISSAGSMREAWLAQANPEPGQFVPLASGGYLLDVPEVALFRVTAGRSIEVAPAPESDPGMTRLFTIGSALGMALHQRGILVLHGATVARNGRARIIVGESGAGKSTLAARLGQAGFTVLGDDTMAVFAASQGGGGHRVWPGSRLFKLWEDSIGDLGIALDGLCRIGNRADKFYVPNSGPVAAAGTPFELAEVLVAEADDCRPRIIPLDGIRALRSISQHTYRPEYIERLGREVEHFRQCAALARDVPVSRLIRPWGADHYGATADVLMARWQSDAFGRAS